MGGTEARRHGEKISRAKRILAGIRNTKPYRRLTLIPLIKLENKTLILESRLLSLAPLGLLRVSVSKW
jgi:hypothetical protein